MTRVFYTRDMETIEERSNAEKNKTVGRAKDSPAGVPGGGEAHKPGSSDHRICRATKRDGRPCGKLAFKVEVCGPHGGFLRWAGKESFSRQGKAAAAGPQAIGGRSPSASLALTSVGLSQREPVDSGETGEGLGNGGLGSPGEADKFSRKRYRGLRLKARQRLSY